MAKFYIFWKVRRSAIKTAQSLSATEAEWQQLVPRMSEEADYIRELEVEFLMEDSVPPPDVPPNPAAPGEVKASSRSEAALERNPSAPHDVKSPPPHPDPAATTDGPARTLASDPDGKRSQETSSTGCEHPRKLSPRMMRVIAKRNKIRMDRCVLLLQLEINRRVAGLLMIQELHHRCRVVVFVLISYILARVLLMEVPWELGMFRQNALRCLAVGLWELVMILLVDPLLRAWARVELSPRHFFTLTRFGPLDIFRIAGGGCVFACLFFAGFNFGTGVVC
jgi:hypothetical protein